MTNSFGTQRSGPKFKTRLDSSIFDFSSPSQNGVFPFQKKNKIIYFSIKKGRFGTGFIGPIHMHASHA